MSPTWNSILGAELPGTPHHALREVHANHAGTPFVEIPCDVARSAAQVDDHARPPGLCGEAIEQLPVERLAVQLVEDALDVLVGDAVVGGSDAVGSAHGCHARH
jgi:hypothetical protein